MCSIYQNNQAIVDSIEIIGSETQPSCQGIDKLEKVKISSFMSGAVILTLIYDH